jgi:hypothetical protein
MWALPRSPSRSPRGRRGRSRAGGSAGLLGLRRSCCRLTDVRCHPITGEPAVGTCICTVWYDGSGRPSPNSHHWASHCRQPSRGYRVAPAQAVARMPEILANATPVV